MEHPLLDRFRAEHASIERELQVADGLLFEVPKLTAHLVSMRRAVVAHFQAKDAFYPALAEQALKANDGSAAQLARIFEANMKVQSGSVQRFFETVEAVSAPELLAAFKTVAAVIRQRFATEERAVFPLYARSAEVLAGPCSPSP
ncbi:MAG: hemerythrin domain-containing protein [Archangium sp.]